MQKWAAKSKKLRENRKTAAKTLSIWWVTLLQIAKHSNCYCFEKRCPCLAKLCNYLKISIFCLPFFYVKRKLSTILGKICSSLFTVSVSKQYVSNLKNVPELYVFLPSLMAAFFSCLTTSVSSSIQVGVMQLEGLCEVHCYLFHCSLTRTGWPTKP